MVGAADGSEGVRMPGRLLTVAEVARWLNVSPGWIADHARGRRRPKLPCVPLGKVLRFDEAEVAAWLKELAKGGRAA